MNDATMTIRGNLVDAPRLRRTSNGHCVANFRVASTPRRFDRAKGTWIDGDTLYVTVTAWRALAENVADSLHKGEPVIVIGRYSQREYEQNDMLRVAYELEAAAVGPDLNRGVSTFSRKTRSGPAMHVDIDSDGIPADQTDHYLGVSHDRPSTAVSVDERTGEVLETAGAA